MTVGIENMQMVPGVIFPGATVFNFSFTVSLQRFIRMAAMAVSPTLGPPEVNHCQQIWAELSPSRSVWVAAYI